ncbi:Lrp/AsnC family transcriptional regulator [Halovivax gelatinilyticus]|uniref:Lrp/AsnC family transcriptional regulator n=1 Tax=Halovivax gelatinilyticus TaxID=2961597 RepID=UPI0020CA8EC3|nr:Lrp/AsnC family transcriptional regulator [Halovivax gelatinilyticus]
MASSPMDGLDEIDRIILGILSNDPRTPYADISQQLDQRGYEMSGEGIRYRVQNLFESTSTFFMLNPNAHDWHVLRLSITVSDTPNAKQVVKDTLAEMPYWFISSGVGSFDVYAVRMAESLGDVDDSIDAVRAIEQVENVEFFLETHRKTDMGKYFPTSDGS